MQELNEMLKSVELNTGKRWKESRLKKNLSVAQLSKISGISKSTIYQREKKGKDISDKTFYRLCDALGLYYTKREKKPPPKAVDLSECIKRNRELKKVSIKELSRISGVSKGTIYTVEKRQKIISDGSIERLAKALCIDDLGLLIKKYKVLLPSELHWFLDATTFNERKKWLSDGVNKAIELHVVEEFFKVVGIFINKGLIRFRRKNGKVVEPKEKIKLVSGRW